MKSKRLRVALVNQRYGMEVNGGSEYYTRQLAEHLKNVCEVEVLTTKALDYITWENYYQDDMETLNGVLVRRFPCEKKRNVLGMRILKKIRQYSPFFQEYLENRWMDAQGPYCPELIKYIAENQKEYTVFIFVTYLYYHTARGIFAAGRKAVLAPTAHDEPYIYFHIFREIFSRPQGMIYLTPEEKEFVENLFPVAEKKNCICGSGVELPDAIDNQQFRGKYKIDQEYFIYIGRIDPGKNCSEMFRVFRAYKKSHPEDAVKLVLMGKAVMPVPEDPDILALGFVSEEDKFNGLAGARALWLPSQYESLSIAVLEALSLRIPVIVNGKCKVLKGHCERSGAGLYYYDEEKAVEYLGVLSSNQEKHKEMSCNARIYIEKNYQWDSVIDKIMGLIYSLEGNV